MAVRPLRIPAASRLSSYLHRGNVLNDAINIPVDGLIACSSDFDHSAGLVAYRLAQSPLQQLRQLEMKRWIDVATVSYQRAIVSDDSSNDDQEERWRLSILD